MGKRRDKEKHMNKQSSVSSALDDRPIEVVGQVRGVQMYPPGNEENGGSFQLLTENGDIIVSPYPAEWHLEVVAALQSNDIHRAKVTGIGEYTPEGKLRCIRQIKSFDMLWKDNWQQEFGKRIGALPTAPVS